MMRFVGIAFVLIVLAILFSDHNVHMVPLRKDDAAASWFWASCRTVGPVTVCIEGWKHLDGSWHRAGDREPPPEERD